MKADIGPTHDPANGTEVIIKDFVHSRDPVLPIGNIPWIELMPRIKPAKDVALNRI